MIFILLFLTLSIINGVLWYVNEKTLPARVFGVLTIISLVFFILAVAREIQ